MELQVPQPFDEYWTQARSDGLWTIMDALIDDPDPLHHHYVAPESLFVGVGLHLAWLGLARQLQRPAHSATLSGTFIQQWRHVCDGNALSKDDAKALGAVFFSAIAKRVGRVKTKQPPPEEK
jgi:hypothetical protein